jgi:phospholipase C
VLKLIEWRWGLEPLTARDASNEIGNIASVFDFANPSPVVPALPDPRPPLPMSCPDTGAAPADGDNTWAALVKSGLTKGWPLYGF